MNPASKRLAFISLFVFWCMACDRGTQGTEFIDRAPDIATTSSHIAIANLNSNIDGMRSALARTGSFDAGSRLIDLLLTRTRYLGSYSNFQEALTLAEELVDRHAVPQALVKRAQVRSAVHDFEGAARDLIKADGAGLDTSGPRSTISLATGEGLSEVLEVRALALEKTTSFQTLTDMAAILAALGRFEEADDHFVEALERYRDVSPFPVAWVHFQRGVMWGEQAHRPDIARPLYERAVRILPQYLVANVHLAELEAQDGSLEQAIARLDAIYEQTEDPEPAGLLAELLYDRDPARARALVDLATETYEHLLTSYPLAFLDHASEFFAGPGDDTSRALQLALENLEYRQNDRAYIVAVEAALADGQIDLADDLLRELRLKQIQATSL